MQQTQRQMGVFQNSINSSMGMISNGIKLALGYISLRAIGRFIKETTQVASDLTEVQNVVDVTFGDMAESINSFAKNSIEQFGLSELSAKKYASTMGAMLKSSGIGGKEMRDMSVSLTQLAADMASFYNLEHDVAFQKIMSGMSGMTMPLKELGINMNIANLKAFAMAEGITKSWKNMTQAEQTMIRYKYLLSVTGDAQGDFARNSQTWANQTKILSQQFQTLKGAIGQGFINVLLPVVKMLNTLIKYIQIAAEYFKAFTAMIFGKASVGGKGANIGGVLNDVGAGAGGIGETAEALGDVEEGLDNVGGAGKKASKNLKGVLADFDEVHTLANKASDAAGGGAGGIGDIGAVDLGELSTGEIDINTSKLEEKLGRLKELFKEGFETGFATANLDALRAAFEKLKAALDSLFGDGKIAEAFSTMIDRWAQSLGQIIGAILSIGSTIATNLMGGFGDYIETNKQYIQDRLLSIFDLGGQIGEKIANIFTDIADIFSVFAGETAQKVTSNIMGIFSNTFLGVGELILRLVNSALGVVEGALNDNKEKIKAALENTLKPLESITQTLETFITNIFEKVFEVYEKHVQPAFDNIEKAISSLVGNLLDNYNTHIAPVLEEVAEKIDILFEACIQPNVEKIIEAVGRIIESATRIIAEVIEPMIENLAGQLSPILALVINKVTDLAVALAGTLFEAFGSIADVVADVCDWFAEHKTVTEVLITFLGSLASVIGIVTLAQNAGAIAAGVLTAATTAWNVIAGVATAVTTAFGTAMAVLTSPITLVVLAITAVIAIVVLLVKHWDEVKEAAAKCWDWIVEKWNGAGEWFSATVIEPVKQFFTDLWEGIKTKALESWQNIAIVWTSVSDWFSQHVIEPIKAKFGEWKENIVSLATNAWEGLKGAWNSATTWFTDTIVDPIKKGFNDAWESIKEKAIGAFNSIKNGVRTAINGVISHINGLIRGINSINFKVPDFLGGGHVGFNIKTLTPLARGGIVTGPTPALIGEAGPEMVVPLENTSFVDKLASALGNAVLSAMQVSMATSNNTSNAGNIVLEIDGKQFARVALPFIDKERQRLGAEAL